MEELAMVYPHLDRHMINMALDFDELMQKKYGDDYHWEDHKDEIFPEDSVDSSGNSNDEQGKDSPAGSEEQGQADV